MDYTAREEGIDDPGLARILRTVLASAPDAEGLYSGLLGRMLVGWMQAVGDGVPLELRRDLLVELYERWVNKTLAARAAEASDAWARTGSGSKAASRS